MTSCPALLGCFAIVLLHFGALPVQADQSDDTQDLIFFGPLRPVFIRLHLYVDGRPFRETWREHAGRRLEALDLNQDHQIDSDEASKAAPSLAALMSGGGAGAGDVALKRFVDSQGGAASIDDCLSWRESTVDAPFSVTESAAAALSDGALLALIDRDRDGRLAQAELADALAVLRRRDFDNNEVLTRPELISGAALYESVATEEPDSANISTDSLESTETDSPRSQFVYVVARQSKPADVAAALLARYDRNRDLRLTTAAGGGREIVLPERRFQELDVNDDAALDAGELEHFLSRGPELELLFEFGRLTSNIAMKPVLMPLPDETLDGADAIPAAGQPLGVRERSDGSYRLALPDAEVDIRRDNAHPTKNRPQDFRFRGFDLDNNRYLDAQEAERVIGKAPLSVLDADGDAMVTETEFEAFITREGDAAGAKLVLALTGQGQNLFEQIDANLDGGLTPRELRTAAEQMTSMDTNGDGYLDGDELPQKVTLLLARGRLRLATMASTNAMRRTRGATRVEEEVGPPWFQKMDRNRDGDLSPREFLGSREVFERLDANQDGLIDAEEADRFEPGT